MEQGQQKNLMVDLGEFLELYLLDSQEQVDKLGAGLLQLEKDGGNISLINDLFRSAHSLKGSSGTMGFAPIVGLTHAAEDLLDRLRQGKLTVSLEIIDTLLEVTDRVKAMLDQVKDGQEISVEDADLVAALKGLLEERIADISEGDATDEEEGSASKLEGELSGEFTQGNQDDDLNGETGFSSKDFKLEAGELVRIAEAQGMGHCFYQLDIKFEPDTVMKAVRAVMAVQSAQGSGKVLGMLPTIEELESGNHEGFAILLETDEPTDEIRRDILGVSELADVEIHCYHVPEQTGAETGLTQAEVAIGNAAANPETPDEEANRQAKGAAKAKAAKTQPAPQAKAGAQAEKRNGNEQSNDNNAQGHTIRVDTSRLDNLINLVGEMVITRTRLVQVGADLKAAYRNDPLTANLHETNLYLGRLMNELQESVMRLRMVPIGTVFTRFPRLVRDLARKTGKEIELVLKGEDTELDKTVVEAIGDPLMHLIRNSVDHGVELPEEREAVGKPPGGVITLDAYHEGNHIVILISDDGAGLPLEKIRRKGIERGLIEERAELSEREIANLIFLPGFSTAEMVTDISGRGVGMDVVKKTINNLGGMVEIQTHQGQGTTFVIRLPLTLAIIQALLVGVGKEVYAIPLSSVRETLLINRSDIKTVGGLPMFQLRGNTLPLISLQEKFELPEPAEVHDEVFVVVVGFGDKSIGIVVDELRGQQEIVIKSLGEALSNIPGIAGATILGNGKVTLILDIASLIQDSLAGRKN